MNSHENGATNSDEVSTEFSNELRNELTDEELDFVVGGRDIWFAQAMNRDTVLSSLPALEGTRSGSSGPS